MADLAEAIVTLGRAAQQRKAARHQLLEATAVVAASVRRQLRRGDMAGGNRPVETGCRVYLVARVFDGRGELTQVLCRDAQDPEGLDWSVLEDIDVDGGDERAGSSPDIPGSVFRRASPDECVDFAHEAAAVVAAFEAELRRDADTYADAARRLTKVVVR